MDRQGESEENDKPVDEEEQKLRVRLIETLNLGAFRSWSIGFYVFMLSCKNLPPDTQIRRDAGLVRSGRFFGGLVNDIKRKKPHYLSDFRWQKIKAM